MKRARAYLASAERNLGGGLYDIACVEAEIAAQLALKAVITRMGLSAPRVHSIRRLIAFITANTKTADAKVMLEEYVRKNRTKLIVLERCREAGQYGALPVDEEEARVALEAAREVVALAERAWRMGF